MLIDGAELDAPAAPLNDLLRPGLDVSPDEVAVVSATRSLTWRELDRAALGARRRLPGARDSSPATGSHP